MLAPRPTNITAALEGRPRAFLAFLWLLQMALVGLLDHQTGTELNFSIFYLLPICFAAWFLGLSVAVLSAIASAVLIVLVNAQFGNAHLIPTVANAASNLALFMIMVFIIG